MVVLLNGIAVCCALSVTSRPNSYLAADVDYLPNIPTHHWGDNRAGRDILNEDGYNPTKPDTFSYPIPVIPGMIGEYGLFNEDITRLGIGIEASESPFPNPTSTGMTKLTKSENVEVLTDCELEDGSSGAFSDEANSDDEINEIIEEVSAAKCCVSALDGKSSFEEWSDHSGLEERSDHGSSDDDLLVCSSSQREESIDAEASQKEQPKSENSTDDFESSGLQEQKEHSYSETTQTGAKAANLKPVNTIEDDQAISPNLKAKAMTAEKAPLKPKLCVSAKVEPGVDFNDDEPIRPDNDGIYVIPRCKDFSDFLLRWNRIERIVKIVRGIFKGKTAQIRGSQSSHIRNGYYTIHALGQQLNRLGKDEFIKKYENIKWKDALKLARWENKENDRCQLKVAGEENSIKASSSGQSTEKRHSPVPARTTKRRKPMAVFY
jgi:hypothetical protein